MYRAFRLHFGWTVGIVLLTLLIWAPTSRADDTVPYRHYTAQDGLPHEAIQTLAQGPNGRLWIGTQGGLAIYDGHDFRSEVLPDSIPSVSVTDIHISPSGITWSALEGEGIVGLRRGRATQILPWPEGANTVERLLSRRDTLLIVTTRALWVLPPEADSVQKRPYDYPIRTSSLADLASPAGRGVWDADLAPNGTLWIVDGKRGPGRLSLDGSVAFADSSFALEMGETWRGLRFGQEGEALLVGTTGAYRLDPRSGPQTRLDPRSFIEGDVYGNTFYGVRQDQVVRWPPSATQVFGPGLGLPRTLYHTVLEEEGGGLWIGTEGGLLHLPSPGARYTKRLDGVDLRWINSLAVDSTRDELWMSSWGKGLFRLRPRPAYVPLGGASRWSLSVEGRDGAFHAVGEAGWFRRTATGWQVVNEAIEAPHGVVRRNGNAYFAASDGLVRVRPDRREEVVSGLRPDRATELDTLWHWSGKSRSFHSFTLAPDGDVLLRDRSALLRFPPGAPRQADTVATIPQYASYGGQKIRMMNGTAYVELNRRGVLGIDLRASPPTTDLVVPTDQTTNLTTSGDSLLFVGSTNGLYVLDTRSGQIRRHLTVVDGLAAQRANAALLYRDTLYVGHENGLSKLPRSVLSVGPSPPTTILTQWSVNDRPHPPVDSARLTASQRTVGFDFAGVHLTRGQNVRYAYRLLPRDTTWTATRRAFTRYTDLPPGTYRFEVRARLEEGPVGSTARMAFAIPEAYYETAWFKGLLILGILGLFGGAYAWRVRLLRRRQEKLQRLVDGRTKQLAEEKEKTERQAKRLEALDAEKNRFFANVSHELRTPLTILRGSIQDLLDGAFGELSVPVREQLEILRSNVERLHRLTDQLLDLARLETTDPALDPEPRDLVALLRRVTRRFVPLAERRGLWLDLETEIDTHPCRFDAEKIEKIAGNLISNALKNTPEGGTVTVRLALEDGTPPRAVLHVKDTGPGIPPERQDEIFERFARAEGAEGDSDGTGIGLALAREYAKLHNGSIEVTSMPGEGSTFTVRLPLPPVDPDTVEAADAPDEGPEEDFPVASNAPSPSGDGVPEDAPDRPVLLVVEDNDDVRAYLRRHLAETYRVVEAPDGQEGLNAARDVAPDLILSDLMMPEMGGIELCRRVRSDEELGPVPIVLLTARAAEDDAVAGLEAGADAYVTKPFSIEELRARLDRLLEAHWAGASDAPPARRRSPDVEATSADDEFLDRVTDVIAEHRSRSGFTVEDLAAEVGLSPRQLQRKLKRLTGETPAAFVRRYRLDAAAQLLEEDAGTVSEIAYEVGFGTPDTFARRFKERFGCPPSRYPDGASDDAV